MGLCQNPLGHAPPVSSRSRRKPPLAENLPDAPGRKPDTRVSLRQFSASLPCFEEIETFSLPFHERKINERQIESKESFGAERLERKDHPLREIRDESESKESFSTSVVWIPRF
jgi:hypothetical protein